MTGVQDVGVSFDVGSSDNALSYSWKSVKQRFNGLNANPNNSFDYFKIIDVISGRFFNNFPRVGSK